MLSHFYLCQVEFPDLNLKNKTKQVTSLNRGNASLEYVLFGKIMCHFGILCVEN